MQKLLNRHLVIPPGDRVYCISDIHGHPEVLQANYDLIDLDLRTSPLRGGQKAHIVHLGDMNDKGPRTRETLSLIYKRKTSIRSINRVHVHLIAGNHEANLHEFVVGPEAYLFPEGLEAYKDDPAARKKLSKEHAQYIWQSNAMDWLINGAGLSTLESYGIITKDVRKLFEAAKEEFGRRKNKLLTDANLSLLKRLRVALRREMGKSKQLGMLAQQYASAEYDHFFFCHAGVDPDSEVPLAEQSLGTKISAKVDRKRKEAYQGYHLVHGHKSGKHAPRISAFSIGIDPKTMRCQKGLIACFEGDEVRFANTDDKKWTAPYIAKVGGPIMVPDDTASHPRHIRAGRLVNEGYVVQL